jgi:hypothetical protein
MKITFKLYAGLSDYLPEGAKRNSVEIDVQSGETVHQVIDRCRVPREQAHCGAGERCFYRRAWA